MLPSSSIQKSDLSSYNFSSLNAFERHKILVNQYLFYRPDSKSDLHQNRSDFKTDWDVLKQHHQFLFDENTEIGSWGEKLAKTYYDKLFKEYAICDLTKYKEGKIGLRWRTEKEVIDGVGHFECGSKHCKEKEEIRTWEMNFAYVENGSRKNALVKLRLCNNCSYKLNYKHRRKEIKRKKSKKYSKRIPDTDSASIKEENVAKTSSDETNIWAGPSRANTENEEDHFEKYLEDLFM